MPNDRWLSAGLGSAAMAMMSSRIDRLMFYLLASGSVLLTIAFSSYSVKSLRQKISRSSAVPGEPARFRNAL